MASAGYGGNPPLHRSTSYYIPYPKTPNPVLGKPHADIFEPYRSRTPLPHEESGRNRKRTQSTWTKLTGPYTHANKPNKPTINWTMFSDFASDAATRRQKSWNELSSDIDSKVRLWNTLEETRRIAAVREAERTRLVQEEVRRIQAKVHMKQNLERLRLLEEMRLAREEEELDRTRRQKAAADRTVANAWTIYEQNWASISSTSEPLSFSSIPWPTLNRPSGPSSITVAAISSLLLSEAHSASQKPKERIKEALLRWHPDRFVRFLRRVLPEEKDTVEETVGIVARCLNELLSRYSD